MMVLLHFFIGFCIQFQSNVLGRTLLVKSGDSVMLKCNNISGQVDKVRWYFGNKIIHGQVHGDHSEYKSDCHLENQTCNIEILKTKKELAGNYRFEYGKSGMPMDIACQYDLVIGGLQCQSNIRENQIMIGESDSPMKPDILRRSCAFRYSGSYNEPLQFAWMKRKPSGNIWRDKVLSGSFVTKEENENVLKVDDEMQVSSDMDETIFECYLKENNDIPSCYIPQLYVQSIKNVSKKSEPIYSSDPRNISCYIDKSSAIECIYDWTITRGNVVLKIEGIQNLTNDHLLVTGNYQCIANCHFVSGENYSFRGTHFEFIDDSNTNIGSKTISGIVLILGIITIIIILCRRTNQVMESADAHPHDH